MKFIVTVPKRTQLFDRMVFYQPPPILLSSSIILGEPSNQEPVRVYMRNHHYIKIYNQILNLYFPCTLKSIHLLHFGVHWPLTSPQQKDFLA